jgi:hypothetical protein
MLSGVCRNSLDKEVSQGIISSIGGSRGMVDEYLLRQAQEAERRAAEDRESKSKALRDEARRNEEIAKNLRFEYDSRNPKK